MPKYIINDVCDVIVKLIIYADVIHDVSCNIAMQLVQSSLHY